jgi:hypothetical protein
LESEHLDDREGDGNVTLKFMLRMRVMGMKREWKWLRIVTSGELVLDALDHGGYISRELISNGSINSLPTSA